MTYDQKITPIFSPALRVSIKGPSTESKNVGDPLGNCIPIIQCEIIAIPKSARYMIERFFGK